MTIPPYSDAYPINPSDPTGNGSSLPNQIDDTIQQFIKDHGFSGSVTVVQNGQPIFTQGYGMANAQMANGPDTTFRLDSVSKLITTTAILQLFEDGTLDLNAPITTYLPEYSDPKKYPGFAGPPPATLFSLLNMTSGIADITTQQPGWDPPTLTDLVNYVAKQPPNNHPGTWHYSNTSFNILAMIIGRVTDPTIDPSEAYGNYLQQNIFDPAGMSTASAPSTDEYDTPEADGHYSDGEICPTDQWPDYTALRIGAGNVNGSVLDFEKFTAALNSGELISMKDVALMRDERLGGWDPGRHSVNGQEFLAKSGQQDGEQSYYMQFPDGTMVFIAANIDPKNGPEDPNGQNHIQYLGGEIASLLYPQNPSSES